MDISNDVTTHEYSYGKLPSGRTQDTLVCVLGHTDRQKLNRALMTIDMNEAFS